MSSTSIKSGYFQNAEKRGSTFPVPPQEFFLDNPNKNRYVDQLPTTVEGCLQEINRIAELQQRYAREMYKLADQNRALASRMREIQGLSNTSNPVEVMPADEDLLSTKHTARDLSKLLLPAEEEGKNWRLLKSTPKSEGVHNSQERTPTEADIRRKSFLLTSIFHWSDVRLQSTYHEDMVSTRGYESDVLRRKTDSLAKRYYRSYKYNLYYQYHR